MTHLCRRSDLPTSRRAREHGTSTLRVISLSAGATARRSLRKVDPIWQRGHSTQTRVTMPPLHTTRKRKRRIYPSPIPTSGPTMLRRACPGFPESSRRLVRRLFVSERLLGVIVTGKSVASLRFIPFELPRGSQAIVTLVVMDNAGYL